MLFGFRFGLIRLSVLTLGLLAQWYLFTRLRDAMRSSCRPGPSTTWAVRLVGVTMGLLFLVNGSIVFGYFPWVDPPKAIQLGVLYPAAVWSFGALFTALLLLALRSLRTLGWPDPRPAGRVAAAPVDLGRRRFLQGGVGGLATAPLVLAGYGAAYASKDYGVEEVSLPFGRSLRVVQVSDIHAGLFMTREDMRQYAEQVIALQPDLFVLTGDVISNSMAFLPGCVEEMARVQARYGTFATLGNHEHWYGNLPEIRALFERHQIALLNNAHRVIQTDQGLIAVAGIDDLQTGHPDLDTALRGLAPSIPTLLLSHRPEIFPQAASRGIPLTLAGHWHGGQIKLNVLGVAVSVAHLRSPYPEGLYRLEASHLYVSRGIGTTATPIRLNAPPEVTLFTLT